MPTVSAKQGGANAHNGLRIPNFRPRRRAAQVVLLAVLLCGLSGELVHLLWPTLLTGKLRYLHLLAPMEALPRSWPLLRLPLLLLLALPLVGWGLISAGRPCARLLIVFPLGAAVIGHKAGERVYVRVNDDYGYYAEIRSIEKGQDDASLEISAY